MANIPISQLPVLPDKFKDTDFLLVSRYKSNAPTDVISYKENALSVVTDICSNVTIEVGKWFRNEAEQLESEINSKFTNATTNLNNNFKSLSTNIAILSNSLTNEWRNVSSEVTATLATTRSLTSTICADYNRLSTQINTSAWNAIEWLKNNIFALMDKKYNELCTFVHTKLVTLDTEQTITGRKTFTTDINGVALSAKWI